MRVVDTISATTLPGREGEGFTIDSLEFRLTSVVQSSFDGGGALLAVFTSESPHGLDQGSRVLAHPELESAAVLAVPSSATEVCVTFTWMTPEEPASA